jgi:hypothetical protein
MIGSYVQIRADITLSDTILVAARDGVKAEVEDAIQGAINGTRSGSTAVIDSWRQAGLTVQGVTSVKFSQVRINGRLLEDPIYSQRDIEFLFANERSVVATIA